LFGGGIQSISGGNRRQLLEAGVAAEKIAVVGVFRMLGVRGGAAKVFFASMEKGFTDDVKCVGVTT